MLHALAKNWGWVAFRGIAALLFGVLTFVNPGITLATLVFLFGIYAFVDGVLLLISSFRTGSFGWTFLGGLVSLAAGVFTFMRPGITAISLLYLIASWAVVRGIFEIATAIHLRKVIDNEWYLILMGIVSVLFGFFILTAPAVGALAVVLWIGVFSFATGILLLFLAFRLRGIDKHLPGGAAPLPV